MIRTLLAVVLLSIALPAAAQAQGVIASEVLSCPQQQLLCGNRIDAQLPEGSCVTTCGEWASVWRVQVFAQTTLITVTASSDAFDPRLDLLDGNSELIESNADRADLSRPRAGELSLPCRRPTRGCGRQLPNCSYLPALRSGKLLRAR